MSSIADCRGGFEQAPFPELCVHDLFLAAARRWPEKLAVWCGGERLTYGDLRDRAGALAGALAARGVGPGERVGVAIGRGVDMVAALLGVLESGAAYVPIDPDYPADRVAFMLEDARLALVVSEAAVVGRLPLGAIPALCMDGGWERDPRAAPRAARPEDPVYAMYTSGSTGRPKCAINTHRGIVNLLTSMARAPGLGPEDTAACLISLSHDMSVADIFLALSVGAGLRVLTRAEATDPALLERALAEGVTSLSATPTTFRMLLVRGWRPANPTRVLMAGEALPPDLVGPLVERGCEVWNGYGMTEASVYTTITRCEPGAPVTIGGRVDNTPVYLLDEALRPVAPGEIGELYHAGVGTGTGYLGRPALSAGRFLPDPWWPGERMYRSGDLARVTPEGAIVYLGRADRQVKIRGFRVELGEVEDRLCAHPLVAAAVAGAAPDPAGGLRLVAWVVPAAGAGGDLHPALHPTLHATLREDLGRALPEWMVPSRFVSLAALPRTPMGKIDREALPAPGPDRGEIGPFVAPEGPVEGAICAAWAELMGVGRVGALDDFLALGGHSLLAAQIAWRLEAALGVVVPGRAVLEAATPRALAARLKGAGEARGAIPRHRGAAPLTDTQRRLWFIQELDPRGVAYNVCAVLHLDGPLDPGRLQSALDGLWERQPALRTRIERRGEAPVQVEGDARPLLPLVVLEHLPGERREAAAAAAASAFFRQPFELRQEVARCSLVRLSEGRHRLLLCVHHAVIDGWSLGVLFDDLVALYRGEAPPAPPIGPGDYAAWREGELSGERLEALTGWWRRRLEGSEPAALPGGSVESDTAETDSAAGALHRLEVPPALAGRLRDLGRRCGGATPFAVLLAGFAAVLRAELGREDVAVGTVVANRERPELERLVGFFANTLVLRLDRPADGARRRVAEARDALEGALAHQEMPFDRLVAALRPGRTPARQPLVRACFILQPTPRPPETLGGLRWRLEEVDNGTAPFDLTLQLWDAPGGGLEGSFLYRVQRFGPARVAALASALLAALEALAGERDPVAALRSPEPEAERALLALPGVSDAAVLSCPGGAGRRRLGAWVGEASEAAVQAAAAQAGFPLDVAARLTRIPLGPGGALDQSALLRALEPASRPWTAGPPPALHRDDLLPGERPGPARGEVEAPARRAPSGEPALLDGGPLPRRPGDPRTLGEALRRAAGEAPDQGVITLDGRGGRREVSYRALLERAEAVAAGLMARGLTPDTPVILQIDDNHALLDAFWGCVLAGLPVLVMAAPPAYRAGVGAADKLLGVWRSLHEPPVIAPQGRLEEVAALLPGARALALEALPAGGFVDPGVGPDDRAILLLTSGSTGLPKVVQHRHAGACGMLIGYGADMAFGPDEVFLNWLGLDHVAPLFMCHLSAVWWGARNVNAPLARFLAEPRAALDWIHEHRATTTFLPNFAFGLLADAAAGAVEGGAVEDGAARAWDLSCFSKATNGGEMIAPHTVRRFLTALAPYGLPPGAMVPIWGMSETCSATLVDHRLRLETLADGERFVPAGPPIPGFAARIVDAGGATLRRGEVGRLLVRGASVTSGYFERPEANAEALVGEGWFDTGDLAFIDDRGVTLTGRAKDVIVVHGANYYSHSLEEAAQAVPGVRPSFVAATGYRLEGDETDRVAVFFAPERDEQIPAGEGPADPEALAQVARGVRAAVARASGVTPSLVLPVAPGDIPKTGIGKIQRTRLRRALEAGGFLEERRRLDRLLRNENTLPAWFWRLRQVPRALAPAPEVAPRRALAFVRPGGEALARALGATAALPGDAYRLDGGRVQLRPGERGDYARLLEETGAEVVFHLWGWHPRGERRLLGLSLLHLLGALAAGRGPEARLDLLVGVVDAGEPEAAMAAGFALTGPHELAGLRARVVSLPLDSEDPAGLLAGELADIGRGEPEVTLAPGGRFVPRLEPHDLSGLPTAQPLAPGAPLLLTGGLGGLGSALAEDLLRRGLGPLLLVGRREAPGHPLLERPGVTYAALNLAEPGALEAAVAAAEAGWGRPLSGAFHLAGAMPQVTLAQEREAGLRAVFDARVEGGEAVAAVVRARRAMLVDFSSINALFGGFSVGAYAAGGRFGAALTARLRAEGLPAWGICWSRWEDVGITRGRPGAALAARRGYLEIPIEQGLASLRAALLRPPGDWIIGLDPGSLAVRARATLPAQRIEPAADRPVAGAAPTAAPAEASALEAKLAAVWAEVLDAPAVPLEANFFDLGGHSLLLVKLQSRLEAALSREISVVTLFQHPTVRALAAALEGCGGGDRVSAARQRAAQSRARAAQARARQRGARQPGGPGDE
jgi:nonribosomal peptide synthetase DhbF